MKSMDNQSRTPPGTTQHYQTPTFISHQCSGATIYIRYHNS
jgi:hypothetical protein